MPARHLILIATIGSIALMVGAYTFQLLGYAPCQMCYWQRYPHIIAIIAGTLAISNSNRVFIVVSGLSLTTTAGLGFFHSGVEQKWWDGPASCASGGSISNLSGNDLLSTDTLEKLVMCDEISWAFLHLSMPTWNGILSTLLAGLWLAAYIHDKNCGK